MASLTRSGRSLAHLEVRALASSRSPRPDRRLSGLDVVLGSPDRLSPTRPLSARPFIAKASHWRPRLGQDRADPMLGSAAMQLMGVNINTIVEDNVAIRCDACLEIIPGTPWRLNILDIVSTEIAVSSE